MGLSTGPESDRPRVPTTESRIPPSPLSTRNTAETECSGKFEADMLHALTETRSALLEERSSILDQAEKLKEKSETLLKQTQEQLLKQIPELSTLPERLQQSVANIISKNSSPSEKRLELLELAEEERKKSNVGLFGFGAMTAVSAAITAGALAYTVVLPMTGNSLGPLFVMPTLAALAATVGWGNSFFNTLKSRFQLQRLEDVASVLDGLKSDTKQHPEGEA